MQDTQEDAVERAHPEVVRTTFAYQTGNALLHLTCCLIGESQREDVPRIHTLLQQVGYLVSQHAGLSRARSSNHQRRSFTIEHRFLLSFVQFIKEVLHIIFISDAKVIKKERNI